MAVFKARFTDGLISQQIELGQRWPRSRTEPPTLEGGGGAGGPANPRIAIASFVTLQIECQSL